LDLKSEIFLKILNSHNEEGELNAESHLRVGRTTDEVCANIGAHDFEDGAANFLIGDALEVTIANDFGPKLKGLGADRIEDREETALKSIFKHCGIYMKRTLCTLEKEEVDKSE
jgi:hypothetical protein